MHSETLVVLVHGFCRGQKDLEYWRNGLQSTFPNILTVDLPTRYGSFECCVKELEKSIAVAHPQRYKKIYFAGHSMGGLLLREYLQRHKPANAARLLCVGTPHYGSKLADIALKICYPAGWIWRPLHALKTSARRQLVTPDIPGLQIGVIVGVNNRHWPGKLFFKGIADGLVEAYSAQAPDAAVSVYTRVPHDPMQYDAGIVELIRTFFLNGDFK